MPKSICKIVNKYEIFSVNDRCSCNQAELSSLIMSAAFSPIIIVGALVAPDTTTGILDENGIDQIRNNY